MKFLPWIFGLFAIRAVAADLTIPLSGGEQVTRKIVTYTCEASAVQMGLPPGPLKVEYINAGGNSLAVVPISGKTFIFVNVLSASGARYVAQQYTWWEAKGAVTISS